MISNAQSHVARGCRQFLDDEGTDAIDWLSQSSDLSPTEQVCHVVSMYPTDYPGALIQFWEEIPPQDTIHCLSGACPEVVGTAHRHLGAIHATE